MPVPRVITFAFAVVVFYDVVFALTVGYIGSSRAVSVGLATLWQDHLAGLVLAAGAAGIAAYSVRLHSGGELLAAIVTTTALDLGLAIGIAAVVGEITLSMVPTVVTATTGFGTQVAAALVGGAIRVRGRSPQRPE